MTLRQTIIADLKRDEGFRQRPYVCSAGKLTIGYGRNLDSKGISKEEAGILLINDITDAEMDLYKVLPDAELFSDNRYRVLVNMVFNLGLDGFLTFKKMLKAIKEKDFNRAANEMRDSKWHKQVGERAERLEDLMRND